MLEKIFTLVGNKTDFDDVKKLMENKETVGEIQCQYMSFDKVNKYFNWSPKHSIEEGLIKTVEWYKKWNTNQR